MKLEAGKYYRNRMGDKVGPMRASDSTERVLLAEAEGTTKAWYANGAWSNRGDHASDLIAEWTEPSPSGAVRTVTRKEIVPGKYGKVSFAKEDPQNRLYIAINDGPLTASELRAAAALFLELADALEVSP